MLKNLSLVIKANQDFVRHSGDDAKKNAPILNSLFDSISLTYIPLLKMIDRLSRDNVPCRFGLVLPPILCNLLSDEKIQELYVQWLDKKISFGTEELKRLSGDESKSKVCSQIVDQYVILKDDFNVTYNRQLIPVFANYMKKGYIELLGTCGTDIYIPHYADMKEVISAQIECGLHAYRQYFDDVPDGFWLPAFGYTPGVEKIIRAYGYTYTIVDSRSVLLIEDMPKTGIFYPTRTDNSLVFFARDSRINEEIFGKEGYCRNLVYKNENRDVGFDLPIDQLGTYLEDSKYRYATGFQYWNRKLDSSESSIYSHEAAVAQAQADAKSFIKNRAEILNKAAELLPENDFVTTVCALDEDLCRKWHEFVIWLEYVFRYGRDESLNMVSCNQMVDKQYELEKISPYYSSGLGAGYGENLLSSKNCWMMRYVRKACERMVDLADRFPNDTGLKTRLLNLGAKELMLAQSLNIPKMIDEAQFPDFAVNRFKESIVSFTEVFDSLGSNTVSTEWLTTLESKDSVFPWMNYRIFSKKQ